MHAAQGRNVTVHPLRPANTVVVINGTLGCGKSTISNAIKARFESATVLHGDELSAGLEGFSVHNQADLFRVIAVLAAKARIRMDEGLTPVLIDYVFECPAQMHALRDAFGPDVRVCAYYLHVGPYELAQRIRRRQNSRVDWELSRARVVYDLQQPHCAGGTLGRPIDTDGQSVARIVDLIMIDLMA